MMFPMGYRFFPWVHGCVSTKFWQLWNPAGESMLNMMICARTRMHRRLQPDLSPGTMRDAASCFASMKTAEKCQKLMVVMAPYPMACLEEVSFYPAFTKLNQAKEFLVWEFKLIWTPQFHNYQIIFTYFYHNSATFVNAQVMGRVLSSGCFFLCGVHLRTGTFQRGEPWFQRSIHSDREITATRQVLRSVSHPLVVSQMCRWPHQPNHSWAWTAVVTAWHQFPEKGC